MNPNRIGIHEAYKETNMVELAIRGKKRRAVGADRFFVGLNRDGVVDNYDGEYGCFTPTYAW